MRKILLGAGFSFVASAAFAASPVTINNAANTDSAAVTGHALNVTITGGTGTNQNVNVSQVGGTTVLTGAGATGAGSQRVTVAQDSATVAGSASLPAGTNIIGNVGIDQTTPSTTNGVVLKPTSQSGAGVTPVVSTATEACHVGKASAGNVYGFTLTTTASATANDWVLGFDASSAPADGAVTPIVWARVSANSTIAWSAPPSAPMVVTSGFVVCLSTTGPLTKTAEAQAVLSLMVR